jgi:hypothetical protein
MWAGKNMSEERETYTIEILNHENIAGGLPLGQQI